MTAEVTPDPLRELFAAAQATPSLSAETPQYPTRRALKAANGKRGRSSGARRPPREARSKKSSRSAARELAKTGPAARTAGPAAKRKRGNNPLVALLVLLVVPGFLISATLPAAAFAPAGSVLQQASIAGQAASVAALPLQQVTVDAQAEPATVSRDTIGATSEAELQAQRISAALFASYNGGARQPGDDYPWPQAANVLSPLNYYYRQCVDFVAWRLNRDAGVTSAPWKYTWSTLTPTGGNASQWKYAWQQHHWKISSTPIVGSVAWFPYNHVAYVKSVEGSNVVIEEYNGMSSRAYAMRTVPINTVGAFLYPPPR